MVWPNSAVPGRGFEMLKRFRISIILLMAAPILSSLAVAQNQPPPAPRHDISGTWEPANGPQDGVQADGVKAMPNDNKPQRSEERRVGKECRSRGKPQQ